MITTGISTPSFQLNTTSQTGNQRATAQASQTNGVAQANAQTSVKPAGASGTQADRATQTQRPEAETERTGRDAAEAMAADRAIVERPTDGIELDISKQGLEKEQESLTKDKEALEQQLEAQEKLRETIREQVEAENEEGTDDAKEAAAAASAQTEQQVTSYAGISDSQLEQMWLQGKISRNDYETEIENREEKLEQNTESMSATDRENAENATRLNEVDRRMGAVNTAFDENSSDMVSAQTRADIVNTLQNGGQTEQARQANAQNEQQRRAFAQWQNDFGFLIR